MVYHLHTKNFNLSEEAKAKIEQKMAKVDKILKDFSQDAYHGDVTLEKETEKELYHAHFLVTVDRKSFFSKKDGYSYEEAIDLALDGVREQLTKYRVKQRKENTYDKRRDLKESNEG